METFYNIELPPTAMFEKACELLNYLVHIGHKVVLEGGDPLKLVVKIDTTNPDNMLRLGMDIGKFWGADAVKWALLYNPILS